MAVSDTVVGAVIAATAGGATAVLTAVLSRRSERAAWSREQEAQRRAALRTTGARYSQHAIESSNTTSAMLRAYLRDPGTARVQRNPELAAELVGSLGELQLLTKSPWVTATAQRLREQLKAAFEQTVTAVESRAGTDADQRQAVYQHIRQALLTARQTRIEFLNAVRHELGLDADIPDGDDDDRGEVPELPEPRTGTSPDPSLTRVSGI